MPYLQGFKDAYEERLAAYLGHTIRSDTSLICECRAAASRGGQRC